MGERQATFGIDEGCANKDTDAARQSTTGTAILRTTCRMGTTTRVDLSQGLAETRQVPSSNLPRCSMVRAVLLDHGGVLFQPLLHPVEPRGQDEPKSAIEKFG